MGQRVSSASVYAMSSGDPMVRLYRAPDATEAAMLVHVLQSDGIPAKSVGGANAINWGEIGADALIVEVWVPSHLVEAAGQTIEKYYADQADPESRSPWPCSSCGEENEGSFEVCWSCQSARPE